MGGVAGGKVMRENEPVLLVLSTYDGKLFLRKVKFYLRNVNLRNLYVCTFEKGGSRKGHHVVLRRRISTLETMEVSDASSHYMSG
jgi:hypothetical protein